MDNILATPPHKLNELICKVGFHNIKTKNILETTRILKEKHDSDVPDRVEDLLELPGIGPKMAFIILSVAHKQDNGIGIDTHMHRSMCRSIFRSLLLLLDHEFACGSVARCDIGDSAALQVH